MKNDRRVRGARPAGARRSMKPMTEKAEGVEDAEEFDGAGYVRATLLETGSSPNATRGIVKAIAWARPDWEQRIWYMWR